MYEMVTDNPGISNITPTETFKDAKSLILRASERDKETTGEDLLLQDIKEIPCLVEPFLQRTGLTCLAGSSDTGKSSLLRQLAISVVTGELGFIGFKINPIHRSVIYVATEDLERETAYLLSRQSKGYEPKYLQGLRFVFDTNDLYNELIRRLSSKPADMVIVDCFSDTYGGDLKDTQKIRAYLHPFQLYVFRPKWT